MAWTPEQLDYIYGKTGGCCEYCGKRLARKNYGSMTLRAGWHVDHSVSCHNGGTDYLRNLFPACWSCNLDKGSRNGKSYRASLTRQGVREQETDWGTVVGWGLLGLCVLGLVSKARSSAPPPPPSPFDTWKPPGWP